MFRPPLAMLIGASKEHADEYSRTRTPSHDDEVAAAGSTVDVIAVRGVDGEIRCSEFHVRFDRAWLDPDVSDVDVFVNDADEPCMQMMVYFQDQMCCFDQGRKRPLPAQLRLMDLKPGCNKLMFRLHGSQIQVVARLFLLKVDVKVISL